MEPKTLRYPQSEVRGLAPTKKAGRGGRPLFILVEPIRFELTTSSLRTRRSSN